MKETKPPVCKINYDTLVLLSPFFVTSDVRCFHLFIGFNALCTFPEDSVSIRSWGRKELFKLHFKVYC